MHISPPPGAESDLFGRSATTGRPTVKRGYASQCIGEHMNQSWGSPLLCVAWSDRDLTIEHIFVVVVGVVFWESPGMCTHTRTYSTSSGTVHAVRGLRVRPFSITPPWRQPHSIFGGFYLLFPGNEVCYYVRSLPWLKITPTQQVITTCDCVASAFYASVN